jgi:hypothetical protein
MKDLSDKYSGVYMNSVLLESFKSLILSIIYLGKLPLLFIFFLKHKLILISITRDNASLNDILIEAFTKYYRKKNYEILRGYTLCSSCAKPSYSRYTKRIY